MGLLSSPPKSYTVLDQPLRCLVCEHDEFRLKKLRVQTGVFTFLPWNWVVANCFICDRCGYVHWFVPR
jgi:uncharacterized protein YlaI